MIIDYIPLAIAFTGTTIAAIWDLKTTEIPDQLPYIMIAIALLFYGYQSFVDWNFWFIAKSVIFGLTFLGFGAFMYYIGQWGSGDTWLLSAIGFLLPFTPSGISSTFFEFPVSYIFNLFIVGVAWMLFYAFILALRNRKIFIGLIENLKGSTNILVLGAILIFIFSYGAGFLVNKFYFNMLDFTRLFQISLYAILYSAVIYILWLFVKSVDVHEFKKRIHISKLKLGDMLSSEKKIVGITEEQLKVLKKSGKKYVDIKSGVPFVMAFPLALFVTVFYGDLILFLINLV